MADGGFFRRLAIIEKLLLVVAVVVWCIVTIVVVLKLIPVDPYGVCDDSDLRPPKGPDGEACPSSVEPIPPIPSPLDKEKAEEYACRYQTIVKQPECTETSWGQISCGYGKAAEYGAGFLVRCHCGGFENTCFPFVGLFHSTLAWEECLFVTEASIEEKDDALCESIFSALIYGFGEDVQEGQAYKGILSELDQLDLELEKVAFDAFEYEGLEHADHSPASFSTLRGGDRPFHLFIFEVKQNPDGIERLFLWWEGRGYGFAGSRSGYGAPVENPPSIPEDCVEAEREERGGKVIVWYWEPTELAEAYVWESDHWELVGEFGSHFRKEFERDQVRGLLDENGRFYLLVLPQYPADAEVGMASEIGTDYIRVELEVE